MGDAGVAESMAIENAVLDKMSETHRFAKDDKKAIRIFNALENFQRFMNVFFAIKVVLFFAGMMTLISGIIGISNIMLIVVKERTREIGVRKAIGATPRSIRGLFLQESLLITLFAGYVGLVLGIGFLEFGYLTNMMDFFGFPMDFFYKPEINMTHRDCCDTGTGIFRYFSRLFSSSKSIQDQPNCSLKRRINNRTMFDYDKWQEIFATIKKNKLRTFLTIFGIGWGIFMIIMLLGLGKGLENGVQRDFSSWATNSGFLWTRKTTISYDGFKPGRYVHFKKRRHRIS